MPSENERVMSQRSRFKKLKNIAHRISILLVNFPFKNLKKKRRRIRIHFLNTSKEILVLSPLGLLHPQKRMS